VKVEYSEYATHYVASRRRQTAQPTWADVAAAYDAGLTHAIAVTPAKRQQLVRYFRALRIINGERRRGDGK
jgi:hypothetical protein